MLALMPGSREALPSLEKHCPLRLMRLPEGSGHVSFRACMITCALLLALASSCDVSYRLQGFPHVWQGRWRRHLDPAISRDPWKANEDVLLAALYSQHSNQWSIIAKHIPGRTAQQCRVRCTLKHAVSSSNLAACAVSVKAMSGTSDIRIAAPRAAASSPHGRCLKMTEGTWPEQVVSDRGRQ